MDFFSSFGLKSLALILKLKKEFSDSLLSPFLLALEEQTPKAKSSMVARLFPKTSVLNSKKYNR